MQCPEFLDVHGKQEKLWNLILFCHGRKNIIAFDLCQKSLQIVTNQC